MFNVNVDKTASFLFTGILEDTKIKIQTMWRNSYKKQSNIDVGQCEPVTHVIILHLIIIFTK